MKFVTKARVRKVLLSPLRPRWPKIRAPHGKLIRLGSPHGGKVIDDDGHLGNSTLLSGGVGEDISFDTEFVSSFKAHAVLVDPVPRAAEHVSRVLARAGKTASEAYSIAGCLDAKSYALENLYPGQVVFLPLALGRVSGEQIELQAPANSQHVSYSAPGLLPRRNHHEKTLLVETVSVTDSISRSGFNQPDIVKLDIEGAALEALLGMFADGIAPRQIIVEVEEMTVPSFRNYQRARALFRLLRRAEYICIHRELADLSFKKRTPKTGPGDSEGSP